MNPWVALPGACRLSRVTSPRQPSTSPLAIQATALRSNSGSGPCGPNWRGPPSSSDRCPVPMMATRLSDGHASTIRRSALPSSTNREGRGIGGAKMLV